MFDNVRVWILNISVVMLNIKNVLNLVLYQILLLAMCKLEIMLFCLLVLKLLQVVFIGSIAIPDNVFM